MRVRRKVRILERGMERTANETRGQYINIPVICDGGIPYTINTAETHSSNQQPQAWVRGLREATIAKNRSITADP